MPVRRSGSIPAGPDFRSLPVARWSNSGRGPRRRNGAGASGLMLVLARPQDAGVGGPEVDAALDRLLHLAVGGHGGEFALPDGDPVGPSVAVGGHGLWSMLQVRYKVEEMHSEGTMAESSSSSPGQQLAAAASPETPAALPIVVKKYANRRLYNTETSSYITLENL